MPIQNWKLILDGPNTGAYNMAVDEGLLNEVTMHKSSGLTYLRFFQWVHPTLSLGFSQKATRVINFDFCREKGIGWVRRITGGKAVLHHKELTYSIVSNDALFFPLQDIGETYKRIAQALVLGFHHLGIDTCLAGEGDARGQWRGSPATSACFAVSNHYEILWAGRKLVGSAQRRTKTAFLQHGSILLDFDPELLTGALGNRIPPELGFKVASLSECRGIPTAPNEVGSHLRQGFRDFFGVNFELTSLNTKQRQLSEELARFKYAQLDWSDLGRTGLAARSFESGGAGNSLWSREPRRSGTPKMA
jgi:lipoyl(octanoyl) transferase